MSATGQAIVNVGETKCIMINEIRNHRLFSFRYTGHKLLLKTRVNLIGFSSLLSLKILDILLLLTLAVYVGVRLIHNI